MPLLEMFPDVNDVDAFTVIGGNEPPGEGRVPTNPQLTTVLPDSSAHDHPVPPADDTVTPAATA